MTRISLTIPTLKLSLASKYRFWMLALLPITLGLGTVALWARSLNLPCCIDAEGLTFPYRRKVPWKSIRKIGVCRGYLDGHISRIEIYHHGRISKIPTFALQNGEDVARIILALFRLACRARRIGPLPSDVFAEMVDTPPLNELTRKPAATLGACAQPATRSRFVARAYRCQVVAPL